MFKSKEYLSCPTVTKHHVEIVLYKIFLQNKIKFVFKSLEYAGQLNYLIKIKMYRVDLNG